jgi:hypothetical protein
VNQSLLNPIGEFLSCFTREALPAARVSPLNSTSLQNPNRLNLRTRPLQNPLLTQMPHNKPVVTYFCNLPLPSPNVPFPIPYSLFPIPYSRGIPNA